MRSILCLGLLFSLSAHAGFENGNGGDVIVCNTDKTELLDQYEARELRGLHVNLPESKNREEVLETFLTRLQKFSPNRAHLYREWIASFFKETKFIDGKLEDVSDSQHVALPKGCSLEQIAIQQDPVFPEDARYIINKSLWTMLATGYCESSISCQEWTSNHHTLAPDGKGHLYGYGHSYPTGFGQAALMIHEIVLREAVKQGHKDSIKTRYFSAYIFSDNFKLINQADFDQLVRMTGLDPNLK